MNRWIILAILFSARAVMGFQFQSISSTSNFLVSDLGIAYVEIGTLVGLYLLPGVVIAYPGGALGKRFGDKRIVLIGLAMMALGGSIIGFGDSYSQAVVGRVICGTGAVFLNVLLTKMLLDWFVGREVIAAMAVLVNSWPFGIALGLLSQSWIAENWSWPLVQYIGAGLSAIGLILVAALYRAPASENIPGQGTSARTRLTLKEVIFTSFAGGIWCLYNVGLIIVISFSSGALLSLGLPMTEAAIMVSIGTWLGIAFLPLGGYVAQRLQSPNAVIVISLIATTLIIVWIPVSIWPLAAFILFGIFAWSPAGPIMALPGEVLSPSSRGPGMGIFFTWYYVGMGLLPALAGLSLDMTGSSAAPIYVAAACMAACIPLLGIFRFLISRNVQT